MRIIISWLFLVSLLLTGCGSTLQTPSATVAHTATTSLSPTPTVTPPLTPIATASMAAACDTSPGIVGAVVGDLIVSVGPTNLNYPALKLPDNLPQAPYKLNNYSGSDIPSQPLVNPNLSGPGGFFITVCNASATSAHRIDSVAVRIDQFTPYTGTLNSWDPCNAAYASTGNAPGGCGGGYQTDANLTAQFDASATTGATAQAIFTDVNTDQAATPPLAVSVPPQQLADLVTHITVPTVPGTYSFSVSLTVDGASTPFVVVAEGVTFLLDPQAREWSGANCQTPTMLAQIPQTTTQEFYICPPAA